MARATFVREYDDFAYTMTDDDVLWLARSLQGECGGDKCSRDHASLVAWTEMNRFLLFSGQKNLGTWGSFEELIQLFSQPVNKKWIGYNLVGEKPGIWQSGGSGCEGQPAVNDCSPERVAGRIARRSIPWDKLTYSARLYATTFAEGGLPERFPGGGKHYVDFAATAFAKKYGTRLQEGCVGKSCNYFLTKEQTKGHGILNTWFDGGVKVVGGKIEPTPGPGFGGWMWIPVVLGGGYLAWKLIKGGKK